jgi:abequosyltransferase
MTRPLLSVIVPTYNRPQHVKDLLDSVLAQDFDDWEMIVGEDCSPARAQVVALMAEYDQKSAGRMRLHLHPETLGYDRGVRGLIAQAKGRFVFVMGDDDFVSPGAFRAVAGAIERHPNLGLILRAFAWFVGTRENVVQITRYYPEECVFPAGREALLACYRRLVVMSGLVIDRDLAHAAATDRWDGSLFYQHWIVGNVIAQREAVYIPDILVEFRRSSPSMFGVAKAEKDLYTPGVQPPDHHVAQVRWQFQIAQELEKRWDIPLMADLRRDFANYAYPIFSGQAHVGFKRFYRYYRDLGRLGLSSYVTFHAWFVVIVILGTRNVERILDVIRRVAGYTPNLSRTGRVKGA